MGLIKALQNQGHEVYAIAPEDKFSPLLKEEGCYYEKVKMDSRGANPIKDFGLTLELFRIYKKIKPDVILHYTIKPNIYGTIAARLLKIPVINNVCGLGTVFLDKNWISKIAILMYKVVFRYPDLIFFQNSHDLDLFVDKKLARKEITDLLPGSGIDLKKFTPQFKKRNGEFVFLAISRLILDKGIIEYVEAVKKLKQQGLSARFQLLGPMDPLHKRGISLKIINNWIENNHIEYLGTSTDVRTFIKNADCIVLPSYREGTPRTLLEAASSAKPIVATNVAGCVSVVEDNYNGFLCKLKDHNDLADKMLKMYKLDGEAIAKMGMNGIVKYNIRFYFFVNPKKF